MADDDGWEKVKFRRKPEKPKLAPMQPAAPHQAPEVKTIAAIVAKKKKAPKPAKPAQQTNQPKPVKIKKQPLKQSCQSLDVATVKRFLNTAAEKYRSAPDAQLANVADFFVQHFEHTTHETTADATNQIDAPVAVLQTNNEAVYETIVTALKAQPEAAVSQMLGEVLTALEGSKSKVGVTLFVQLLLRAHPASLSESLLRERVSKAADARRLESLAVSTWAIAQLVSVKPHLAFSLWAELLVPLLRLKWVPNETKLDVLSWTQLLTKHRVADIRKNAPQPALSVGALQTLFATRDSLHRDNSPIAEEYGKLLSTNIDAVFAISVFGASDAPRKYLDTLLRLASGGDEPLLDSILQAFMTAVLRNEQCMAEWQRLYPKLIAQSSNAVHYMSLHFSEWNKTLDVKKRRQLKYLVEGFEVTNQLLAERRVPDAQSISDQELCVVGATCQELLAQLGSSSSNAPIVLFVSALMLTSAVVAVHFGCHGAETLGGLCQLSGSLAGFIRQLSPWK